MLPSSDHVLTRSATVKNGGNGSTSRHRRAPLSATEATLLAYALFHGRLSASQACRLAGANGAYFAIVNAMNDHERDLLARGEILLADLASAKRNGSNGNGKTETLVEHLRRASVDELRAAGREFGVAHVFDNMIVPNLDGKGADVIVTEVTEVSCE